MIADVLNGTQPWWFTLLYGVLNAPLGIGTLLFSCLLGGLPAYATTMLLGPPLIARLQRASAQQVAYEDAPATHQAKTGTPTMGGLLFAVVPVIALLLNHERDTLALAVLVLACMGIGAFDDLAKIRGQRNRGLGAPAKLGLTAVAAVVFLSVAGPQSGSLVGIGSIPNWVWYVLSVCAVVATTHAVNLTDGLDGLAGSVAIPPLVVLICIAGFTQQPLGVPIFGAAMLGAVLGFLNYNRYPARLFMGDTGSLALGGAIAGVAVLDGAQLLLLVIGGVFVGEALSVILQVASFKTTGRRIFRMSPLHHHFELEGWPEQRVTKRFWIASAVLSLVGFALIVRTR
jgi:phospho-N-acetylmuramoyl-pentapeptide-transferase